MPFDKANAADALDANVEMIREYLTDDDDLLERYREALESLPKQSMYEIRQALRNTSYPGALPTKMHDETDSIIHTHFESASWESHEAVNEWAREVLLDVPMLAVDGSEIPPTTQFNLPVAYVQAAWCVNHHSSEGRFERGWDDDLLTPSDLTKESNGGNGRPVDSSLAGLRRYELEGKLVVKRMEELAEARNAGELTRPPVVLYDGPLVVAFVTALDEVSRQRYIDTISKIIAASRSLEIPLVGYVAGTDATDLTTMIQNFPSSDLDDHPAISDARVLAELTGRWGDQTTPFVCRRNWSVDDLSVSGENSQYQFTGEILFSYLNVPPGSGLDRIEFPDWLVNEDGPEEYDRMYDYVVETVRAEAAIGRGYPELLQQADSDAVLDQRDRDQFLRLVQNWAEENDIPLEWDAKALSKERRRR
ncbi:DNA double-strand break repair nuclease NurA [Halococcus sp. IIIV-5B]|uniref:DNA double-strand break repair nuclease NurA n=1 Tax=Halococcus sp. IIIV-5B TaxID=2321230 RepID=UPI000E7194B8|nr:DNA double-strand break repair nuclease NurA [Halococcus sp. IIIV-5B]RJT08084.1 DNA double-strand break repair nuclease NurA [Halococcus sp. IIIV-5B]